MIIINIVITMIVIKSKLVIAVDSCNWLTLVDRSNRSSVPDTARSSSVLVDEIEESGREGGGGKENFLNLCWIELGRFPPKESEVSEVEGETFKMKDERTDSTGHDGRKSKRKRKKKKRGKRKKKKNERTNERNISIDGHVVFVKVCSGTTKNPLLARKLTVN